MVEHNRDIIVDRTITNGPLGKAMPAILGYIHRHHVKFGGGHLPPTSSFFDLPLLVQTYIMEYAQGCAVPTESIVNNGESFMLMRSGETNAVFGVIKARAKELNPCLYHKIRKPKRRLLTEPRPHNIKDKTKPPVITHERYATPRKNKDYIYPMQRIYGYAAPRILIEIMGRGLKRTQLMSVQALNILDKVLKNKQVNSLSTFTAILSNEAIKNGANPVDILSHVLTKGILNEQGCKKDYQQLAEDLKKHAPKLWQIFLDLDPKTRMENGIIHISDIFDDKHKFGLQTPTEYPIIRVFKYDAS